LSVLIEGLESNIHGFLDLSFALPVLWRWGDKAVWQNRFGERWTHTRLLETHLDREATSLVCGGTHWRYALSVAVASDPTQQLDTLVLARARQRLAESIDTAFVGMDAAGRLKGGDGGVGYGSNVIDLSVHAHTLEWLFTALSDEQVVGSVQLHRAVAWLIDQSSAMWNRVSYRDLAHVAHALHLYLRRMARRTAPR
jgi:hypothetical protein